MQYRTFKNGDKVSLLGFGTMRLPCLDNGKVDHEEAIKMMRSAIDAGVNYLDTAYVYHNGESEIVLAEALEDGYREKVYIADKVTITNLTCLDDAKNMFEEQFRRLRVEYIDYYLIHNVTQLNWEKVKKFEIISYLLEMKEQGRIKNLGFSFHDDYELFEEVLDAADWDFCQIQLNYMDAEKQAGVKGLKAAAERGLSVIIMEPLKGGRLTDNVPESIKEIWDEADVKRTPAEWAFRWVADFPEVTCVLSGMSTFEQVEENINFSNDVLPNSLTEKEHDLIKKVADKYNELIKYSCTGCKYCMPCPKMINIPLIIERYNEKFLYGDTKASRRNYSFIPADRRADACIGCRSCETKCPQKLPISDIMKLATEFFGK